MVSPAHRVPALPRDVEDEARDEQANDGVGDGRADRDCGSADDYADADDLDGARSAIRWGVAGMSSATQSPDAAVSPATTAIAPAKSIASATRPAISAPAT